MKNNENVHKFEDGRLVVYLRENSRFYQCRMLLPDTKRYVRESLKTTDLHQAITDAKRRYMRLIVRQEQGLAIFKKKFSDAAKSFEKEQERLLELGKQSGPMMKLIKGTLRRYIIPFFGTLNLDDIRANHNKDYFMWRIENSKLGKPPATKTLLHEYWTLRKVYEHAIHHGWIAANQVPDISMPKEYREEGGVRPGFTNAEWKTLQEKMITWVDETTNPQQKYTRTMIRYMALIITYTGIRTNDIHQFRWRDVEDKDLDGQKHICVYLRGKGIEAKWCVAQPEARTYIEEWRKISVRTDPDDLVFCTKNGGQLFYSADLKDMLREFGMLMDANGNERTMYSFRHTYAMMRLLEGVNVFDLAKNMRTSVAMIQKHYGSHISALQRASEITEGTKNAKGIKFTPTMELKKSSPDDIALTVVKKARAKKAS